MGTKNNPGNFDCYANAEPDEPMFVLLGRDALGGQLVRLWALERHRNGEDEEKVAEALKCANAMDDWARAKGKDVMTAGERMENIVFPAVTEGMDEHPEDFDRTCDCNLCRSYA